MFLSCRLAVRQPLACHAALVIVSSLLAFHDMPFMMSIRQPTMLATLLQVIPLKPLKEYKKMLQAFNTMRRGK